jgi:hypothetical protein
MSNEESYLWTKLSRLQLEDIRRKRLLRVIYEKLCKILDRRHFHQGCADCVEDRREIENIRMTVRPSDG